MRLRIAISMILVSAVVLWQMNTISTVRSERNFYHYAALRAIGLAEEAVDIADQSNAVAEQYRKEVTFLRIEKHIEKINRHAPAHHIAQAIVAAAADTGIDPIWLTAMIEQESHFHVKAVGRSGERGLTQMTHTAAMEVGLEWKDAFLIDSNVYAGARYLAYKLNESKTMHMALLRYNGSEEYPYLVKARYVRIVQ